MGSFYFVEVEYNKKLLVCGKPFENTLNKIAMCTTCEKYKGL